MGRWIAARELVITWGDTPNNWIWTTSPDTMGDIAELIQVNWFDIRGQLNTASLPLKTSYTAYFVFKLKNASKSLEKVTARVRLTNEIADGTDNQGFTIFLNKERAPEELGIFPQSRNDGWMELKLGMFFNNLGGDGSVDMRLFEINTNTVKSGLLVRGIELRPN